MNIINSIADASSYKGDGRTHREVNEKWGIGIRVRFPIKCERFIKNASFSVLVNLIRRTLSASCKH